ncbi:MAG: hypothetical protein R3E32_17205 [Chitinophagales bacterium]
MNIPIDLVTAFEQSYNKTNLERGLKPFVDDFFLENRALCMSEGVPNYLYLNAGAKRINKTDLVDLCCVPFINRTLFDAFRKTLPKEIATILAELVWREELGESEIKSLFGIEVCEVIPPKYSWGGESRELKKMYYFFAVSHERWSSIFESISLPVNLRKRLMAYYPKPKNFDIHTITPTATDIVYSGEKDIFLELPRLLAYYGQDNIKLTTKQRPMLSGMSKMQRTLNLREFFEDTKDKVLKNLRTNAIAGLLVVGDKVLGEKNLPQLIKNLFNLYQRNAYFSLPLLLTNLKGTGYIEDSAMKSVEHNFVRLLKELPIGDWVAFENIEDFTKYRMFDITPINKILASDKLYFSKKEARYNNKEPITKNIFYSAVTLSLLKANFFLFAAFGLVEIAYNVPDTSDVAKTYFSPYDGLQFVRLTELGAYVMSDYGTYKQAEDTQQTPLVLSEDSLMILSDETDLTADILLQNYTQKVGPNRYQTDYTVFLKDCRTAEEMKNKIELFKKTVTSKLPANWKAFFEELVGNIQPFEDVSTEYVVFKIPSQNRMLIQLIAQDAILKKYIQKAEGFQILVLKSNISKFRNRLKDFGFFLN